MGYYSEVVLAMPESEWDKLASQDKTDSANSVFVNFDRKIWFEHSGCSEVDEKWVLIRWNSIKWYWPGNDSITAIQHYVERCEGPFEFLRLGEEIEDVEYHSNLVEDEVIGAKTEAIIYV